jgi:hypothetical protein
MFTVTFEFSDAMAAEEAIRAVDAARAKTDLVSRFVADRCELAPEAREPLVFGVAGLYPAFEAWCYARKAFPVTKQSFRASVLAACPGVHFEPRLLAAPGKPRRNVRMFFGIRLRADAT